jgi:hypothetical protein
MTDVPAHVQKVTHSYSVSYPEHGPRTSDPHYADFHAYKALRRKAGTYYCDFAKAYRGGDTSECDNANPLECHHRIIEFATLNSVDLALLEPAYPGVSTMGVGAWVESAENLELLCVKHHRGNAGVHTASASDYAAYEYVRRLLG